MKKSKLVRKKPLRGKAHLRPDTELKRRTPLKRGRWQREPSALWKALEGAGIEIDKGIFDRLRHDEDRMAEEWQRVYHSPERVAFVKSLRCCVPNCYRRDIENHHIETGGKGRKAGYDRIVPMCRTHHREWHGPNCGRLTFVERYSTPARPLDIEREAEWTEHAWQACGEEWSAQEYGDPHHDDPDEDRLIAYRHGGMD